MQIDPDEITSILKSRIEGLDTSGAELTEVGTVLSVADGICRVHGLENCMSLEMLEFPHDVTGLALNLESDNVGVVLFGEWEKIVEGDTVKRTKHLLDIPVGEELLGRIADTSASVDTEIADGKAEVEQFDRDNFSRRVALLIDSLNSTSIDVTKLLSNEASDSAWSAYLRGDRGVFTRRAVRLIEGGEAREITRHYEEETEFREQVNRYIHDFEALLRPILSTRDGSTLAVILLSSDMGKLYVALAQAIERLRA